MTGTARVTHWLAVRQDPAEAARVIGNPRIPPDTRLRHAPALFTLDPKTAVDAFIADDGLDVTAIASRVIDPLVVAVDPGDVATAEGARYLTHAVTRRRVTDRGVHDLTLRLLVRRHDKDPHALVRYLDGAGWDEQTGVSRYDPLLAADLCERAGAVKAAIRVHCDRGDHDRAIALAMRSDDLTLAKSVLDAVDGARGRPVRSDPAGYLAQDRGWGRGEGLRRQRDRSRRRGSRGVARAVRRHLRGRRRGDGPKP